MQRHEEPYDCIYKSVRALNGIRDLLAQICQAGGEKSGNDMNSVNPENLLFLIEIVGENIQTANDAWHDSSRRTNVGKAA